MSNVAVREYSSEKAFEKDANKWVRKGFTPTTVIRKPGHFGTNNGPLNATIALATGGLGLLFARTKAHLIVTYVKVPGR